MKNLTLILAVFAGGLAQAQSAGDDDTVGFELPGADVTTLEGDGGLDLGGAEITGGSLQRLAEKWPDDLVMAPVPGRSPQLGWNLKLAGGYFLESRDEDSDSSPSILGGFAMIAENGSYAYGGGANLHLLDDKLRVTAGAGYLDVRYQFYGVGNETGDKGIGVDILQEAPIYFAQAKWRVWNKLYLGLGYLAGDVETRLRFTRPEDSFIDPSLQLDIAAYTIPIEYDTRDHEQFPRSGWNVKADTRLYRKSLGGDVDAETYKLAVNHYRPMRDRDALALRAVVKSTGGDYVPFFLMSSFGGSKDLRGYPSGRYRDRKMYAVQGEYRWQFNDRWIFTSFAGVGEVAEHFSEFGENYLPAAGIGARFILSQKHRVGLSADIAVGNDGTEFYFGVGEAF